MKHEYGDFLYDWYDEPHDESLPFDRNYNHPSGKHVISLSDHNPGGGQYLADQLIEYLQTFCGDRTFDSGLEWCSGPAYLGFTAYFEGRIKHLTMGDINDRLPPDHSATIRGNNLPPEDFTFYLSDCFDAFEPDAKFDFICGAPPWFKEWDQTRYADEPGIYRKSIDPGYSIHRKFFQQLDNHLTEDGVVILAEQEIDHTVCTELLEGTPFHITGYEVKRMPLGEYTRDNIWIRIERKTANSIPVKPKLWAFGCSFTAGDETYDEEAFQDHVDIDNLKRKQHKEFGWPFCAESEYHDYLKPSAFTHGRLDWKRKNKAEKENAWPRWLGDLMDYDVMNRSCSGSSNWNILHQLTYELEMGNIKETDVVIVATTSFTRHTVLKDDTMIGERLSEINTLWRDYNHFAMEQIGEHYDSVVDGWLSFTQSIIETHLMREVLLRIMDRHPNVYWIEPINSAIEFISWELQKGFDPNSMFRFYSNLIIKQTHNRLIPGMQFHSIATEKHAGQHPTTESHKTYAKVLSKILKERGVW